MNTKVRLMTKSPVLNVVLAGELMLYLWL